MTGTEIKDYVVDVNRHNTTKGEYKLILPIAGPASMAGYGTPFNIKFVFKLESLVPSPTVRRRFLEVMKDRVLADADVPVSYTDINGFKVAAPTSSSESVAFGKKEADP